VPNNKLTTLLVFTLTTNFYIFTLLPSLAWGDGTKLQSEAISGESFVLAEMTPEEFSPDPFIFSKVGVAAWDHPLYIILGHLLIQAFPLVDPLWLVNLISALFGAASVALVFQLCFRFTESILASCYAAFSLAVCHTFWWHSSTPEVYTLFVFLLLVSVYLFDHYERTGKYSFLVYSAFFLGLAASNHLLAFLVIPALGLYYLLSKDYRRFHISQLRELIFASLGFLSGFILYIIQFARMAGNFPLNEIMGPVIGSTFLSQLVMLAPVLLGKGVLNYLFLLTLQFSPIGVILGVFGIRKIFGNRDLYLRKIIALFIVFTLFGILYRVSDQFAFFITSYVFWVMMMGIGANHIFSTFSGKMCLVLAGILALMILGAPFFYKALPGLAEKAAINDASISIPQIGIGVRDGLTYYINPNKHGDFNAYDFGNQTLTSLGPQSVVLAEWYTDTDEYFILRYFTKVKKVRSDVTVVGWPTQDPFSFNSQLALDLIEDSFPKFPIYLASLSNRFYAASKLIETYCIVPENNLYRLYQKANNDLPCLENDSVTE
jgi:hypothetical protein